MNLFKNALSKFIMGALALGILMPKGANAATGTVRDETLDYECRPRWDRFIVDENTTNWDKNAIACYDKYGNEIDPSKLYGAPKMYGEYEAGANNGSAKSASAMYGTPGAEPDYARMYGKYDPSQPGVKPKPQVMKAAAPAPKKSEAKEMVKPKPVAKPKAAPVVKPVPAKVEPQPVQAPPPPVVEEPKPVIKKTPAPKPVPAVPAQDIAKSLNEKIITEESYCTEINPAVKGQLPKGIVLMTGRPDLMSCVKN